MNLNDLNYSLIAGKGPFTSQERSTRNAIFEAWLTVWSEVYGKDDANFRLASDDFLRQDLISCVSVGGKVAALHFYSFFDVQCQASLNSKYFQFFNRHYLNELDSRKVQSVMSMEYFTVAKEFRKSQLGFSLAQAVAQMGTYLFAEVGVDAIVAPARNDLRVNQMAYELGFSCIEKDTIQRGFKCDLIACFKNEERRSPDFSVNRAADFMWERRFISQSARVILSQLPLPNKEQLERVA